MSKPKMVRMQLYLPVKFGFKVSRRLLFLSPITTTVRTDPWLITWGGWTAHPDTKGRNRQRKHLYSEHCSAFTLWFSLALKYFLESSTFFGLKETLWQKNGNSVVIQTTPFPFFCQSVSGSKSEHHNMFLNWFDLLGSLNLHFIFTKLQLRLCSFS